MPKSKYQLKIRGLHKGNKKFKQNNGTNKVWLKTRRRTSRNELR